MNTDTKAESFIYFEHDPFNHGIETSRGIEIDGSRANPEGTRLSQLITFLEANHMKLIYRGAGYDYEPNNSGLNDSGLVESPSQRLRTPYVLNYRGSKYRVFPDLESAKIESQSIARLVYRGNDYSLNGWVAAKVPVRSEIAPTGLRSKTMTATEVADVHRSNLYHNVQRRLRAAQELGDADLIRLLERELQQIA